MAYIEVEVGLDDFSLDEILEEIGDRYYSHVNKKPIQDFFKDLLEEPQNPHLSLLDQMKIDLFLNNLNKITINDLEKLL
jgi:hypothetical protein